MTARAGSVAPRLEVDEAKAPGLAQMVAGLLGPAIEANPRRASRVKGSLALRASDHDAGVTLRFECERILVVGRAEPDAWATIEAPLMTLGALAQGGHAVKALRSGEVKVRGALRHPLLMLRVRRLLTPGDSRRG